MAIDHLECALQEIKAIGDAADMAFSGYGAVFGNKDSYGDVLQEGAFSGTIQEAKDSGQWPAMLEQHGGYRMSAQDKTPIGIWTSMKEDNIGLYLEGKFAPTQRGKDMYALMKMQPRPAINGLSIGYIAQKSSYGDGKTTPRRTLEQVKLIEVSPVTFPANPKARVTNIKSDGFTERDFERLMQDAGFSRSDARTIINQGFKSFQAMQDAGSKELDEIAKSIQRNIDAMKG